MTASGEGPAVSGGAGPHEDADPQLAQTEGDEVEDLEVRNDDQVTGGTGYMKLTGARFPED